MCFNIPLLPHVFFINSKHRMREKEPKSMKTRIIVVRDGMRDHGRPVARLWAPQEPAIAAKSSGKRLDEIKTMKKVRCQEC